MKTVKYHDYCNELERVKRELGIGFGTEFGITIHDTGSDADNPLIELGVNWGSIGTVDVKTAQRFAAKITAVAQAAANFKYNGYKIKYGRD